MQFSQNEYGVKYSQFVKILLIFSALITPLIGILFHLNTRSQEIFPGVPSDESEVAALACYGAGLFVLLVFWAVLPRRLIIFQDRIQVKCGLFSFRFLFRNIDSVIPVRGVPLFATVSFITSYGDQVNIKRRNGMDVRVSPANRDQFLEQVNRALADWRLTHQSS